MQIIFKEYLKKIKQFIDHPIVNFFFPFFLAILLFEMEVKGRGFWEMRECSHYFPFTWISNIYKTLIIVIPTFCVIQRKIKDFPRVFTFSKIFLLIHVGCFALYLGGTYYLIHLLSLPEKDPRMWLLTKFTLANLVFISAFLSFVNIEKLKEVFFKYKKEWLVALVFGAIFSNTYTWVQKFWKPLASSIGNIVAFFLKLNVPGIFFDPHTNKLGNLEFGVGIGEPCSGVEGISLFVILFTALLVTDWKQIKKFRALLLYPIGIVIMYCANILRIYLIMILGFWINSRWGAQAAYEIVVKQFHSHVGWILYTVVILLFVKFTYPFLIGARSKKSGTPEAAAANK